MISVAIPVYNGERYVADAIDSMLAQTYADFELILVDDGSTDGTIAIAESYARRDPRVRVVAQENGGISRAMNRGIAESRFDWVAFLDHDDVALPERLEKQVAASQADPDVVAWGTYAHTIDSKGRRLGYAPLGPPSREAFAALRARGLPPPLLGPSMFLHRATVLAVGGFDSRFDGNQDTELLDRMAEVGPVLAIPEPLVLRRIHDSNISRAMLMPLREKADYIRVRSRARVAGETPPTLEAFLEQRAAEPAWRRAQRRTNRLARLCFRTAGLHFAQRRYIRTGLFVAGAALLSPAYIVGRIWDQRLSADARYRLKAGRS